MCIREETLRQKIEGTLSTARKVLDTERNPQIAEDVHHKYNDKYMLAEFMTNGGLASHVTSLRLLGLKEVDLKTLKGWSADRTVTVRFSSSHKCSFIEKKTREVESPTKEVATIGSLGFTKKTVTTVTEYFWKYEFSYELSAYKGTDVEQKLVLRKRSPATTTLKTTSEKSPHPEAKEYPHADVDATWLLAHLNADGKAAFSINRSHKACCTPYRNDDVDKARQSSMAWQRWAGTVQGAFVQAFAVVQDNTLDMSPLTGKHTLDFVPFAPLLEDDASQQAAAGGDVALTRVAAHDEAASGSHATLPMRDLEAFLTEEERWLKEKFETLAKVYPASDANTGLITQEEAVFVALMHHISDVCGMYAECMMYIEEMLRKQLVAAIGKEVSAKDFAEYMEYHNRRLFKAEFAPKPFSLAVRRPNHYPEGTVSVFSAASDVTGEHPVPMLTRKVDAAVAPQMRFALSAASDVTLCGEMYVHACVGHRFSFEQPPPLTLGVRARQFSGYVMLLGRIGGADLFLPSHAMIVQNKDEFEIPLNLEEIPSAQEFRDAIESLSPEQQRFAKAFRSMQLESTLFAVCVVQIKPQLEKVLNLPPDSLTKEIRLAQQLLELFIEYHIPPDLLSFQCDAMDDPDDIPAVKKVDAVKAHVAAMYDVIKESKQKELDDQKMRHEMAKACAPPAPEAVLLADFGSLPGAAPAAGGGPPMMRGAMMKRCKMAAPMAMACAAPMNMLAPQAVVVQEHAATQQQQQQPQQEAGSSSLFVDGKLDVSAFPHALEKQFEAFSDAACIRPTIIKPAESWTKKHQPKLLGPMQTTRVSTDEQRKEKNKAFDLLDALTRSGVLAVDECSVHVILGATHCFDDTLLDTLVRKNVNPIERVERSMLLVASTLFGTPTKQLLKPDAVERVETYSPMLFIE